MSLVRGNGMRIVGVVAVVILAVSLTPAGAHVGGTAKHLWRQHLAPLAKKTFFTKKQSTQRFAQKTQLTHIATTQTFGGFTGSTDSYDQRGTWGSFSKSSANTVIRLTWAGTVTVATGDCEFQLRIDGKKDTGSSSSSIEADSGASAFALQGTYPVNVVGYFEGLARGTHDISLWQEGSVGCGPRSGVTHHLYVEEFVPRG